MTTTHDDELDKLLIALENEVQADIVSRINGKGSRSPKLTHHIYTIKFKNLIVSMQIEEVENMFALLLPQTQYPDPDAPDTMKISADVAHHTKNQRLATLKSQQQENE